MGIEPSALNLTNPNPEVEQKRRQTYPGMASWGGAGPQGKTCRECVEWTGCGRESGYYAAKGLYGGTIKPRCCDKYRELMGDVGEAVPHNAPACRYFDPILSPPPIVAKRV